MDKLKPCPFCGGKAGVMYAQCEGETTVAVVCQTCNTGIFRAKSCTWDGWRYKNAADAVDAWNRRAKDERSCRV